MVCYVVGGITLMWTHMHLIVSEKIVLNNDIYININQVIIVRATFINLCYIFRTSILILANSKVDCCVCACLILSNYTGLWLNMSMYNSLIAICPLVIPCSAVDINYICLLACLIKDAHVFQVAEKHTWKPDHSLRMTQCVSCTNMINDLCWSWTDNWYAWTSETWASIVHCFVNLFNFVLTAITLVIKNEVWCLFVLRQMVRTYSPVTHTEFHAEFICPIKTTFFHIIIIIIGSACWSVILFSALVFGFGWFQELLKEWYRYVCFL